AVRDQAASALGQPGPAAGEAVRLLAAALEDENEIVRGNAASALGQVGPAAEVIPLPAAALKDRSGAGRAQAARALARIGRAEGQEAGEPFGVARETKGP